MEANAGKYIKNYFHLKRLSRISLHFKLVPVQCSLLSSRLSGCHATLLLGGALRDIPKDGCEGDYVQCRAYECGLFKTASSCRQFELLILVAQALPCPK